MSITDILLPDWLTRCAENYPEQLAVQCGQEQGQSTWLTNSHAALQESYYAVHYAAW